MSAKHEFVPPVPELLSEYAEALKKLREEFGEPKSGEDRRKLKRLEAQLYRDHYVDPSTVPTALWAHD